MKVIVIGLGSMGKRRIRLLSEHQDIEIFGIDSNEERCKEVEDKYGVKCFISINKAKAEEPIECAFVCTSPLSHAGIIKECLQNNLHVFICLIHKAINTSVEIFFHLINRNNNTD